MWVLSLIHISYGAGDGVELTQVYPTVYQGKLEQSAVNLNNEMTRLMISTFTHTHTRKQNTYQ